MKTLIFSKKLYYWIIIKYVNNNKKLEKLLGELDKGDLYLNKLLLMFEKKLKQLSKKNI